MPIRKDVLPGVEEETSFDVGADDPPEAPVQRGSDLSRSLKITLGSYLSNQTQGLTDKKFKNDYPISKDYNEVSITNKDGTPAMADNPGTRGSQERFVNNSFLEQVTNRSRSANAPIADFFSKGKQSGDKPNGNTLLRDELPIKPGDSQEGRIQTEFTSKVLEANRFTSKRTVNHSTFRTKDGKNVDEGLLAKVGDVLMARSVEQVGSSQTGFDPDSVISDLSSVAAPGATQTGASKVDIGELYADSALKALLEGDVSSAVLDSGESINTRQITSLAAKSNGSLNTPSEPFAGLAPIGMVALANGLILALQLAVRGILSLLTATQLIKGTGVLNTDSAGRYILGRSGINPDFLQGRFPYVPVRASVLNLYPTNHPFDRAVQEGIRQVFGNTDVTKNSDAERLRSLLPNADTFQRSLESPGFYVVLIRSILRSANEVLATGKNTLKGGPVDVAQNVINIVDVLRRSKIVAALNMFAQIGDITLYHKTRATLVDDSQGGLRISEIDAIEDEKAVHSSNFYKQRLKNSRQLSWSNSTSPTLYNLPRTVLQASAEFGKDKTQLSEFLNIKNSSQIKTNVQRTITEESKNGRISSEVAREIESQLDAEYVPFYFHDLRTNEIVSFHAFLASLTDSYQPKHAETDAYGRVEGIPLYQGTNRRVAISFFAAATSEADFDRLWVKINKLVTLVYPQFSQGRVLTGQDSTTNKNFRFVQPFSQIITASPVIRMRIGDLFRSNYSKFNLARLFGLGTKNFLLDESSPPNAFNDVDNFANLGSNSEYFYLRPGTYKRYNDNNHPSAAAVGQTDVTLLPGVGGDDPATELKIDSPVRVRKIQTTNNATNFDVVELDSAVNLGTEFGKRYLIPKGSLMFASDELERRRVQGTTLAQSEGTLNPLATEFFKPGNNAIVRSFESVAGKGLACVVTTLEFDWYDRVQWETARYGSVAPMMCKITMQFNIIHDIAPGLDSQGFNRAPVYPVGNIVNGMVGNLDGSDTRQDKGRQNFETQRQFLNRERYYKK